MRAQRELSESASPGSRDSSQGSPAPRLPYSPALDGVRALAVLAVLFYHARVGWMRGGFLGVEVFFVISGYLITSLLLAEWIQCGHVDLRRFWLRRGRRLVPALVTLVLAAVAFTAVFLPTEGAGLRGDALSSLVGVSNWYQLLSHQSYFESVGRPSLLRHMWSLGVEGQFYVLWPPLFCLLMRRGSRRLALAAVLVGSLVSALLMAGLYHPDTDPSRPYYGTDTRACGLLLGAALAFVWSPRKAAVSAVSGRGLSVFGLATLGVLAACSLLVTEFQAFLYRGGFALVGLTTAGLIAATVHPRGGLVPRALAWGPLRWVGVRSYGIYLWHFPVFMVTRPHLDVPIDGVSLLVVRFALTTVLADLCFRLVETPVRTGALERSWAELRAAHGEAKRRLGSRWALASLHSVVFVLALGVFLFTAERPAPPAYLQALAARATADRGPAGVAASSPPIRHHAAAPAPARSATVVEPVLLTSLPVSASLRASPVPTDAVAELSPKPTPEFEEIAGPVPARPVTAIGDSVMQGAADELRRALGGEVIVDVDQGRLPWRTPDVVRELNEAGKIHPTVILHIGDNGVFRAGVFDRILAELKDARLIVVVNVRVPRPWEHPNNSMLRSAVARYPGAVLVDWYAASRDRPEVFWQDGIHLRPEGARFYADLLAQAVTAPDSVTCATQ